jgi:RND superfamily putative drug exporter
MFETLGAFVHRHPRRILIAAGAFLLVSIGLVLAGGRLTGGTIRGLEAERAEARVERVTGVASDTTLVAVFSSPEISRANPAALETIDRALLRLRHDPRVHSVVSPLSALPPLDGRMVNDQAHTAYALISLNGSFTDAAANYPDLRKALAIEGMSVAVTGRIPFLHDLDHMLARDLLRAEAIALPIAVLVLLLVFRTVVAAILPVAVGALAVLGGIGIVMALSHVTELAVYTVNVASLIGLGVAIDYSLFTVSRYREELAAGHDYREALIRAMATAGRVVAFSGLAVGTGLAGLFFFRGSYLVSMGLGGAIVVALAVLFALTVLPALLVVLGPNIHRGRLSLGRLIPARGVLVRMLEWVIDHPWRVLVPVVGLLVLMAAPFLHLRMAGVDETVLGLDAEARRGHELLRRDFPDMARNRIVVAVEFPTAPALTRDRIGALYDLSRRIAALPGVAKVESLVDGPLPTSREAYQQILLAPPPAMAAQIEAGKAMTVGDRVVLLYALTDLPSESEQARGIVHAIRARPSVGDGSLVVGGQTAHDVDSTRFIVSRAPYTIAFVVCVTLVVLYLAWGSVVLPIKAVVMNFLSIAASLGALVWVFQEGHLLVDHARPIDPTVPILLFCILFGLSMDYHVLMVSRIREAHERLHDNSRAVTEGLLHSAGLITSAAAIMVTVFGAFALAHFVVIRAVGFGMALAVALDATLIRVVLVPAAMRLLGEWNWWSPRWLPMGARHLHAPREP